MAMKWIKENNIKFHIEETFDEKIGESLGYDLVINATGFSYSAPFMQRSLSDCVSAKQQVFVNEYCQVTN